MADAHCHSTCYLDGSPCHPKVRCWCTIPLWVVVRCSIAVVMVSYIVRCEQFSARVCRARTVIPVSQSSCIAPDVIVAAWYPMCDGHATQVLIFNGVTRVETYWIVKRVPHCLATDVVVLHPMHWKDDRVTTSLDSRSTDLSSAQFSQVLSQWWWAGEAGLTRVDVGHSHEPPQSTALLLQLTEELVSSLLRCGSIAYPVRP